MRAVHLRGAGDHVLDVVGVARAVDVRVVPLRGRVLDVARRDRQDLRLVAAALRLGRLGDFVVRDELRPALVGGHLRERRGQGGLAVVDVADGADVHVRFAAIEFFFSHVCDPRVLSALCRFVGCWSRCPGSNWRPRPYQGRALPTELHRPSRPGLGPLGPDRPPRAPRFGGQPSHGLPAEARSRSSERRLERETGIEPATNSLEGCDSTTELLPPSRSHFVHVRLQPLRRDQAS